METGNVMDDKTAVGGAISEYPGNRRLLLNVERMNSEDVVEGVV